MWCSWGGVRCCWWPCWSEGSGTTFKGDLYLFLQWGFRVDVWTQRFMLPLPPPTPLLHVLALLPTFESYLGPLVCLIMCCFTVVCRLPGPVYMAPLIDAPTLALPACACPAPKPQLPAACSDTAPTTPSQHTLLCISAQVHGTLWLLLWSLKPNRAHRGSPWRRGLLPQPQ